jgi:hypothetical protein
VENELRWCPESFEIWKIEKGAFDEVRSALVGDREVPQMGQPRDEVENFGLCDSGISPGNWITVGQGQGDYMGSG